MSSANTAFTFPGQGSQFIGMGHELAQNRPAAKEVFQEVDDTLGQKLSDIIFTGDEADLKLTENTQPALMAVSMAVVRVMEAEGFVLADKAQCVAGHSLGEYSALCASGVFSLADTAKLLKLRGQAMQRAVPVGEGAMAAIIGLEIDDVVSLTQSVDGEVGVANDNSNGQVVISGSKTAVEAAAELAKEKGAKRALLLPVSAPFHCNLMAPAAREMEEALASAQMSTPCVPVMANVTANLVEDTDTIRGLLVEQITGRVRWRESVIKMAEIGVENLVEVGAGKVLSGLARRIDRNLNTTNIESLQSIDEFMAQNS